MYKYIDKNTKYKELLHIIRNRLEQALEVLNREYTEDDNADYLDYISKVVSTLHLFIVNGVITETELVWHLSKTQTKVLRNYPKKNTSRLIHREITQKIRDHELKD